MSNISLSNSNQIVQGKNVFDLAVGRVEKTLMEKESSCQDVYQDVQKFVKFLANVDPSNVHFRSASEACHARAFSIAQKMFSENQTSRISAKKIVNNIKEIYSLESIVPEDGDCEILCTDNQVARINKMVLKAMSEFANTALDWKARDKVKENLDLSWYSKKTVDMYREYLYSSSKSFSEKNPELSRLNCEEVAELLRLAHFMEDTGLLRLCQDATRRMPEEMKQAINKNPEEGATIFQTYLFALQSIKGCISEEEFIAMVKRLLEVIADHMNSKFPQYVNEKRNIRIDFPRIIAPIETFLEIGLENLQVLSKEFGVKHYLRVEQDEDTVLFLNISNKEILQCMTTVAFTSKEICADKVKDIIDCYSELREAYFVYNKKTSRQGAYEWIKSIIEVTDLEAGCKNPKVVVIQLIKRTSVVLDVAKVELLEKKIQHWELAGSRYFHPVAAEGLSEEEGGQVVARARQLPIFREPQ